MSGETGQRRLLYISAHFPPSAASGVFRTLGFLRGLCSGRWDVSLLALEKVAEERVDSRLLEKVPDQVDVWRTGYFDPFALKDVISGLFRHRRALEKESGAKEAMPEGASGVVGLRWKDHFGYLLKTPDSYVGWVPFAVSRALFSIKKPELILATAPPFSALLSGVILKKVWQVPLVVDFRDPWILNPFRALRPGLAGRLDRRLERMVLRHAEGVVLNTNEACRLYQKHYPEFTGKMITITNGFDDRFDSAVPCNSSVGDFLRIVHVGALYGARSPVNLFKVLGKFPKITVELYGPGTERFKGLANDGVFLAPPVEHGRAISLQKGADVVLLIGNCVESSVQVPAKLFEALAVAKNIWLIDSLDSPTRRLLLENDIPHYFSLNDPVAIEQVLKKISKAWLTGALSRERLPIEKIGSFSREKLAAKLDELLMRISREKGGCGSRV